MSKGSSRSPSSLRVDRLLANLGYGSRREMQKLVKAGDVTLDGHPFKAADDHVSLADDLCKRMLVYDEFLDPLPGMVILLHKPLGVTCSHKEPGALVYDLFPERWARRNPPLSTIGRLDKETTGLLLLTDDGDFLHRVISPNSEVTKRYHVTLSQPLRGQEGELFASGSFLLEGDTKPLLPVIFDQLSETTAHVTLTEGRYHQIRRMFATLGNDVIALHRETVGQLTLPKDLMAGDYRLLEATELNPIFSR